MYYQFYFECSYPTYEEWKPSQNDEQFVTNKVLILPMRNGNLLTWYQKTYNWYVLILPMRNGNECACGKRKNENLSSYPTYEEWKLLYN